MLRVLFYNLRKVKLNLRSSAYLIIKEVEVLWEKARIPTRKLDRSIQKVESLYQEWKLVQKTCKRRTTLQEVREYDFLKKMNDLFDIAHADLDMMAIEEDKAFLVNQRKIGRPGSMIRTNRVLLQKERRQILRREKEKSRKVKYKRSIQDAAVAQDIGEQVNGWNHTGKPSIASGGFGLANIAVTDLQSAGKIKFYPPKVPVLFVLGGPGSGKVTHCDTFMQERRGVTHINMMDLLQQYVMGNDMQDFSQLSSKTVTEVLMLEMKMAPSAKAYLISGYPRSMRDAVEYSEKIQVVSGVILISWRKSVLEKQIDYGSKLGHVVLSLAKMELENFFKNVIPVADYFDQNDLLSAVNGERAPAEVYKDFRTAVLDILSSLENQEAILNGVTGMGRGVNDIPGSIVSVDTAPSEETNTTDVSVNSNSNAIADKNKATNVAGLHAATNITKNNSVVSLPQGNYTRAVTGTSTYNNGFPPVIWVIGGPGSNKAMLCLKAVESDPSWGHISVGRLLRSITDSDPRANTEKYTVKEALSAGEMAPEKFVNTMLDSNIRLLQDRAGIIIDGYPRNLNQVKYFENKYKQRPSVILLDCSKLQLGRGRIDDTVSSFRRRLELFRELTLPMLKVMDSSSRLQIIDGDTDSPSVQREFEKIIHAHISLHKTENDVNVKNSKYITAEDLSSRNDCLDQADAILHDLDNIVPRAVPTISNHVSLINGHRKYCNVSSENHSGQAMDFKDILKKAEQYPEDSYI